MSKSIIKKIFNYLNDIGFNKNVPDEIYLRRKYKKIMNKDLNLDNPQTFNEKLQWLKIHDRNPLYVTMVDKYEAKKYVGNIIGTKYIVETIGVWDKFANINFDELPDQFVLKCTHDSGGVMVCTDKSKFNYLKSKLFFDAIMKRNYYYRAREWPYKHVKHRIIAEKYIGNNKDIIDYKLMCFNGKFKYSFVCTERFSKDGLKVTFFDKNWNKMPFTRHYNSSNKVIEKPKYYDKMIELAEKLSKGLPFMRVDFYEINNKIYFGELTLYPGAGFEEFTPEIWDKKLGDLINLNVVKGGKDKK